MPRDLEPGYCVHGRLELECRLCSRPTVGGADCRRCPHPRVDHPLPAYREEEGEVEVRGRRRLRADSDRTIEEREAPQRRGNVMHCPGAQYLPWTSTREQSTRRGDALGS